MPSAADITTALYGSWRLFVRDRSAIELFDDSVAGFWRSFFSAVVVLAPYGLLLALSRPDEYRPVDTFRLVSVEAISYVVSWLAWPLLVAYLTPLLDRNRNYVRYVVAYNWSALIQVLIFLALVLAGAAGLIPKPALPMAGLLALGVVAVYHMFICQAALEVSLRVAFALVVAEFFLSQLLIVIRYALLYGAPSAAGAS